MLPYALAVIAIFVNPKITKKWWLQCIKSSRDHLALGDIWLRWVASWGREFEPRSGQKYAFHYAHKT